MRTVYWAWSMILTAAIVVQIGLAGYGAFYAANKLDDEGATIDDDTFMDGFGFHAGFGYLVILLGLIFLLIGIAAGIGKWRLGRQGAALPPALHPALARLDRVRAAVPVGFLHPINAMLILALSSWISWDEWQRRKTGTAAPPAEAAATCRAATRTRCRDRRRRGTAC